MTSVYQTALSGLKAFSTKLQVNSNNIANANTNGFKKSVVQNTAVASGGVEASVQKVAERAPDLLPQTDTKMELVELSNVDLATELIDMKLNSTMFKANLKTIETVDEMTATLLDVKS